MPETAILDMPKQLCFRIADTSQPGVGWVVACVTIKDITSPRGPCMII